MCSNVYVDETRVNTEYELSPTRLGTVHLFVAAVSENLVLPHRQLCLDLIDESGADIECFTAMVGGHRTGQGNVADTEGPDMVAD